LPLLGSIILFTAVGGIASAAFAGLFLLLPERTGQRMLPHFVSFATGALIGAALLGLLPEAMEAMGPGGAHSIGIALIVGLGVFFIIEKLVLWRHAHSHENEGSTEHEDSTARQAHRGDGDCGRDSPTPDPTPGHSGHDHGQGAHDRTLGGHAHKGLDPSHHRRGRGHHNHDHGRDPGGASGVLVLIGDSIHNALDGVLIAAAFLTNVPLGLVTTMAVAAHEIPHRVGDFAILVHAGMSRQRAMFLNMATGLASVVGGIVAYFGLSKAQEALPYALALAAAGFLYIAVAGLIPGLHRRADPRTSLAQVLLMGLGVGVIAWAESLTH
jgi:zinc and cadmium transporter